MLAGAMIEKGDMGGRAVWLRILRAVEKILEERSADGAGVH